MSAGDGHGPTCGCGGAQCGSAPRSLDEIAQLAVGVQLRINRDGLDRVIAHAQEVIDAIMHERRRCAAIIRRPNEDGTPCSAEREMLARRVENGETP